MKSCKPSAIQPQMFQFVDMDKLVPKKHILRQLNEAFDFSIVHDWVVPLYTKRTGRPAADPEQMIRPSYFRTCSITPNGNCINYCPCIRATCGFADWIETDTTDLIHLTSKS